MSEPLEEESKKRRPAKLAKRRRKLPTATPPASAERTATGPPPPHDKKLGVEEQLQRLAPEVLRELKYTEDNQKLLPGKVHHHRTPSAHQFKV